MASLEINVYLYATLLIYSSSLHTFSLLSEIQPKSFWHLITVRMVSSIQQLGTKYLTLAPWVEERQKYSHCIKKAS